MKGISKYKDFLVKRSGLCKKGYGYQHPCFRNTGLRPDPVRLFDIPTRALLRTSFGKDIVPVAWRYVQTGGPTADSPSITAPRDVSLRPVITRWGTEGNVWPGMDWLFVFCRLSSDSPRQRGVSLTTLFTCSFSRSSSGYNLVWLRQLAENYITDVHSSWLW